MVKITAAEAIKKLTKIVYEFSRGMGPDIPVLDISIPEGKQIAALIEQQAAEIAKYQRRDVSIINQVCNEVDRSRNADMEIMMLRTRVNKQQQEIAKKDRMIERATWVLDRTGSCPKTCDLMRNLCAARACWLAWLEKEAEVQE